MLDEELSPVTSAALSRRTLLQVSGAGALALTLPMSALAADAPVDDAPAELRRASYLGQIGQAFSVAADGSPTLTLDSVDDVAGAARDTSLAGRDDVFVLSFSGSVGTTLSSHTYELEHPALGPISLFLSPVDRPGDSPRYEVVVDRSVKLATALRVAPAPATAGATSGSTAAALPAAAHAVLQRLRVTAKAKRVGGHVVASLKFPGGGIQAVEVQLLRHGKHYASGTAVVKHGKVAVTLKSKRTVKRGTYDLVITATTVRTASKSVVRVVKIA